VCGPAPAASACSGTPHAVPQASLLTRCLDWRASPPVTVCRRLACLARTGRFSLPSSTCRRVGRRHPMPCNADGPRRATMRHHVSGLPFPCWIRLDASHESGGVRANPRSKSIHACGRFPVSISTPRIHGPPAAFIPGLSVSPINDLGLLPSCRARPASSRLLSHRPSPGTTFRSAFLALGDNPVPRKFLSQEARIPGCLH
jgi:hypothetical protein